ncbi:unnamed protein product [Sympodiomycopsis kandeliae]
MTITLAPARQPLRILLLGGGGREHALAHHLLSSSRVEKLYMAPANGALAEYRDEPRFAAVKFDLTASAAEGWRDVIAWSKQQQVNLVIPGPEQPLVDGVEMAFREGEKLCYECSSLPACLATD